MKKKILSFYLLLIIFVMLLSGLIFLSACDIGSRYDNKTLVDGVYLMRNKLYKKSLAAYCEWDGDMDNMEFTVPDEYCGYKVKCLGAKGNPGFTGNPGPFNVYLPDKINGYDGIVSYSSLPPMATAEDTVTLEFTVNIGKYVNELEQISGGGLYGYGIKNDSGNDSVEAYYRVKIYYNIDSDNATFYSKDGDIYYKSNDKKVEYRF